MSAVTILMGTYNGDRFIGEQLETIGRQTFFNWSLKVSDDGSSDETIEILKGYQRRWGEERLRICRGPGQGFCKNFLSLACDPGTKSEYYAFSDQDDLWNSKKMTRAISWLDQQASDVPALYCGRTQSIDESGNELGLSPFFKRPPSFRNALVQSIGGGNTMVFNEAARKLIVAAGHDVDVPSHDWWLYILVTGCSGVVHYDSEPMLLYRQHGGNLVGTNMGLAARRSRIIKLLQGRFRDWNLQHRNALCRVSAYLSSDSIAVLRELEVARGEPLLKRLRRILNTKIHRQTFLGQVGLLLAVALGKF